MYMSHVKLHSFKFPFSFVWSDSEWERDDDASSESTLDETTCKIWLTHFSDVDVFVKDETCVIGKMLRAFPLLYQIDDPEDDLIIQLWMCNSDNDTYNVS